MKTVPLYEWLQPYGERIKEALAKVDGPLTYVRGEDVRGEVLRTFSDEPVLSGPLVCQLCQDMEFIDERDFAKHKECDHAGEVEYRKRVLYLLSRDGCRRVTGQEKRMMVQHFSSFQQFCRPGAKWVLFRGLRGGPEGRGCVRHLRAKGLARASAQAQPLRRGARSGQHAVRGCRP